MVDRAPAVASAPDGSTIRQITLQGGGLRAQILTWGATLQGLWLDGIAHSLVLGCPDPVAYRQDLLYFGAIVGPVANRIAGARFDLDGRTFRLDANENGARTLHGGSQGFSQRNWRLAEAGADHCTLELDHPDGLCGFPGPLQVSAAYRLDKDALLVRITGHASAPALFAPAFHAYWNLDSRNDLSAHLLAVAADTYLPVDRSMIPVGGPASVAGTAFDYRSPAPPSRGLDHAFCLTTKRGALREAARLTAGGVRLILETTEPGLQVYASGFSSSGPWPGHGGKPFGRFAGIALEPQVWPNAANRPDFPSARIRPGEPVTQVSRFVLTRDG